MNWAICHIYIKYLDRQVLANNVDPEHIIQQFWTSITSKIDLFQFMEIYVKDNVIVSKYLG